MSEGKNAYEVRLDLLKMAKEMLDQQYSIAIDMGWKQMEQMKDAISTVPGAYLPAMFTPEEVVAQAEKFQEFINKK